MRTTIRLISLACASTMLFACSGMGGAPAFQQAPAPRPSAAGPDADGYYALGRAQHGALRYAAALAAYRRALQLDPAHVNARNGLAVLHAGRGEYAEAIALWRALLPAEGAGAGPQAAFLWGNLGYAYFLSGADEPALAALEQACLLDPLNALSWEHLGELLQRMGQGERAALMRRQAASLRQHDYRRDYALLAAGDGAAAGAPAAPPPSAAATAATSFATSAATATSAAAGTGTGAAEPPAWPSALAQTEVRREGAALVSVHRVAAGAAVSSSAARAPAPGPPTSDGRGGFRLAALTGEDIDPAATLASVAFPRQASAGSAPARLEISNGNGVAGMAAALARTVAGDALQVVRLSNVRYFAVPASRVEFQQPQEAAARALAARLGLRVAAQGEARGSAELRIVLGRDLRDPALLRQRYLK